MKDQYESELSEWIGKEKAALDLLETASKLQFEKSVELVLFRRKVFDKKVSEIISDHAFAEKFTGLKFPLSLSRDMVTAIAKLDLAPSRIDIGRLCAEYVEGGHTDYDAFVTEKLKNFIGKEKKVLKPRDVVLYGFGRIGRLAARILIEHSGGGQQLRLRAIVTRDKATDDLAKRASLLRKDSVHGRFAGVIEADVEGSAIIINGHRVHMITASSPGDIDYTKYSIEDALIIDNTGVWRDEAGLSEHLKSKGVSKVILTAPGKGDIPNIVYGVNHEQFDPAKGQIFTAASCTTNAIVPVLKVIKDTLGIERGHIETVHAYTNDQNLLDNYHKKSRRGRSAPNNMVITETGAGKAVTKIFPEMKGMLTSNAVRVPVQNVSLAILSLRVSKKTSVDDVNALLKKASLYGDLVEQLDYSMNTELVSSDVVGNSHACEVDSNATIVSDDGQNIVVYAWYDNEYGYTNQVVRLTRYLAGVRRLTYY
ncbi:MAG: glyceraldehyde-3-phosphate dehydrogenase, type [Bacteroidetes bacterium]|nr:glyceraldehyde-3-phosphate dehydrogenase, type [Bacteroidota bacterium]